ncbi:MAG: glycosyltransferase [Anaerohalosphaeraceae bacterium]|nr:glycosyltransferase [Anaerohalosphaeraceae bacterium]
MTEPLITIATVNYNTADFVELIIYSLKKLTCNSYKLIVCDNGSNPADIEKIKRLSQENEKVELFFRQQNAAASMAHGQALDLLIEKSASKYTAVLDSDCVFLLKNWDIELTNHLDEKVKIFGATSPSLRAGPRLGGGDFPLPFAAVFETEIFKSLEISCTPGDITKGQDTSWQWRQKFSAAGLYGKVFTVYNTRDFRDGFFAEFIGVEEYYLDDGKLVASHFGRGASLGAAKYMKWFRVPLISTPIKKYFGKSDKKKWIKKCYQIIDSQ